MFDYNLISYIFSPLYEITVGNFDYRYIIADNDDKMCSVPPALLSFTFELQEYDPNYNGILSKNILSFNIYFHFW